MNQKSIQRRRTIKIVFLFLMLASLIHATGSLTYGACRDVPLNFNVYRIHDTPGDTSYPTSPFIPGAYYGTGAPSNGAGACDGPNEVLVGITQPKFTPYGTNIFGYGLPPASPNPTGSQNATARCCQLTVSGSVPITFSKNGPLECTNPMNINAYSPVGSFAHDDNFDFVDTYSNYIFGSSGGAALYACGTSYTSAHPYSFSGTVFTPGGSLSLNNRVACAAVYYTLAAAGKTEVVPACCTLNAASGNTQYPLTTQITQWSTWTSTINGKPAAICPDGQFVIGINVNQGVGGGLSGVLCGTFDTTGFPSPTPAQTAPTCPTPDKTLYRCILPALTSSGTFYSTNPTQNFNTGNFYSGYLSKDPTCTVYAPKGGVLKSSPYVESLGPYAKVYSAQVSGSVPLYSCSGIVGLGGIVVWDSLSADCSTYAVNQPTTRSLNYQGVLLGYVFPQAQNCGVPNYICGVAPVYTPQNYFPTLSATCEGILPSVMRYRGTLAYVGPLSTPTPTPSPSPTPIPSSTPTPTPTTSSCSVSTITTCQASQTRTTTGMCSNGGAYWSPAVCPTGYTLIPGFTLTLCAQGVTNPSCTCFPSGITGPNACIENAGSVYNSSNACNPGDKVISTTQLQHGCAGSCNSNTQYQSDGICTNLDAKGNGECQYATTQTCPLVPTPIPSNLKPVTLVSPTNAGWSSQSSGSGYQSVCPADFVADTLLWAKDPTVEYTLECVQVKNGNSIVPVDTSSCTTALFGNDCPYNSYITGMTMKSYSDIQGYTCCKLGSSTGNVVHTGFNSTIINSGFGSTIACLTQELLSRINTDPSQNINLECNEVQYQNGPTLSVPLPKPAPASYNDILVSNHLTNQVQQIAPDLSVKKTWSVQSPTYAVALDNGDILAVSDSCDDVTEVGPTSNIVWQYGQCVFDPNFGLYFGTKGSGPNQLNIPTSAQRLDNGNTLITDSQNDRVIEVTPDKNIAWQYATLGSPIQWAERRKNGDTVIISGGGQIIEEINSNKQVVWTKTELSLNKYVFASGPGGFSFVHALDNGNTLVGDPAHNRVMELNPAGGIVWQRDSYSVIDAERLTDGNTLITFGEGYGGKFHVLEVNPSNDVVGDNAFIFSPISATEVKNQVCPADGTYACPYGASCTSTPGTGTNGYTCTPPDNTWNACGNGQTCPSGNACVPYAGQTLCTAGSNCPLYSCAPEFCQGNNVMASQTTYAPVCTEPLLIPVTSPTCTSSPVVEGFDEYADGPFTPGGAQPQDYRRAYDQIVNTPSGWQTYNANGITAINVKTSAGIPGKALEITDNPTITSEDHVAAIERTVRPSDPGSLQFDIYSRNTTLYANQLGYYTQNMIIHLWESPDTQTGYGFATFYLYRDGTIRSDSSGGRASNALGKYTFNQWHHVRIDWNDSGYEFYLDGTQLNPNPIRMINSGHENFTVMQIGLWVGEFAYGSSSDPFPPFDIDNLQYPGCAGGCQNPTATTQSVLVKTCPNGCDPASNTCIGTATVTPSPTPTPSPTRCRTPPKITHFGGSSTNIAALLSDPTADLTNVNNFALEVPGQFKLTYRSPVDICGLDLDNQVTYGPGFVGLNDGVLPDKFIQPNLPVAVILSYPSTITHPSLVYAPGFHTTAADIHANAHPCPPNKCQNVAFINGKAIFDAASFSTFLVTDTPASPTPSPTTCPDGKTQCPTGQYCQYIPGRDCPVGPCNPYLCSPNPTLPGSNTQSGSNELRATCPHNIVTDNSTTVSVFYVPGGVPTCINQAMQVQAIGNNSLQTSTFKTCDPLNGQHTFNVNTTTSGDYQFTASANGRSAQCSFTVVGRTPTPSPEMPVWLALVAALGAFAFARKTSKVKKEKRHA